MVHRVEKEVALSKLSAQRRQWGLAEDECTMCALVEGRGTPAPLFENDEAIVVLDRFGAREGHLLLIVREHLEHVTDLGRERHRRVFDLCYDACEALQRALSPTRVFVAALGAPKAVPMSFPHFHVHLIPLFEEDERTRPARVFSWTDGVVTYDEEQAQKLAERICSAWPASAPHLHVVASGAGR